MHKILGKSEKYSPICWWKIVIYHSRKEKHHLEHKYRGAEVLPTYSKGLKFGRGFDVTTKSKQPRAAKWLQDHLLPKMQNVDQRIRRCLSHSCIVFFCSRAVIKNPSRELTYHTCGKGKSSSKVPFWGDMLVPRRVYTPEKSTQLKGKIIFHPPLNIPSIEIA